MKVIIIKKFAKFNTEGNIVEVKDGYARNFLIPKGFALEASRFNLEKFENLKKQRIKMQEHQKNILLKLKEKIETISLTISAQVKENDELYGSITEGQILKALKEEDIELEKGKLLLEEPIKKIGVYNIKVNLHPEIVAEFRLWVVKK